MPDRESGRSHKLNASFLKRGFPTMRTLLISVFALSLLAIPLSAQVAPPSCSNGTINVCTLEGIDASQIQGVGANVDPNGAVGTSQYLEWADPVYQGYSKTFPYTAVWSAPVDGSTPWRYHGLPNCVGSSGNVVVNFDKLAQRFVIGRRQSNVNNGVETYEYCIAISASSQLSSSMTWDPSGFVFLGVLV